MGNQQQDIGREKKKKKKRSDKLSRKEALRTFLDKTDEWHAAALGFVYSFYKATPKKAYKAIPDGTKAKRQVESEWHYFTVSFALGHLMKLLALLVCVHFLM